MNKGAEHAVVTDPGAEEGEELLCEGAHLSHGRRPGLPRSPPTLPPSGVRAQREGERSANEAGVFFFVLQPHGPVAVVGAQRDDSLSFD